MRFFLPFVFCVMLLVSCRQNKDNTPVLGSLDSTAIALDTTMQLGLESSYEFHKTIPVNTHLVYDVVGFGGSVSKGEYAILRRGAGNQSDTVQKGIRYGLIADAQLKNTVLTLIILNPADTLQKQLVEYRLPVNSEK